MRSARRIFWGGFCAVLLCSIAGAAQKKSTGTVKAAGAYSVSRSTKTPRPRLNKSLLFPPPVTYKYNEPGDLIELVPILRDINAMIPRQFSLADHEFVLDSHKVQIRHSFYHSPVAERAVKNSVISFSYAGSVGRQFRTNLDVPLFYSSIFGFSDWSYYPIGNYTMTVSRDGFFSNETYYLKAITRF